MWTRKERSWRGTGTEERSETDSKSCSKSSVSFDLTREWLGMRKWPDVGEEGILTASRSADTYCPEKVVLVGVCILGDKHRTELFLYLFICTVLSSCSIDSTICWKTVLSPLNCLFQRSCNCICGSFSELSILSLPDLFCLFFHQYHTLDYHSFTVVKSDSVSFYFVLLQCSAGYSGSSGLCIYTLPLVCQQPQHAGILIEIVFGFID